MESTSFLKNTACEHIQYVGVTGITRDCIDSVIRYLQNNESVFKAKLITCKSQHNLLLYTEGYSNEVREKIIVRAGFSSGYGGEGPNGLSYVLTVLDEFGTEIEEIEVSDKLFDKINQARLTTTDLEKLESTRPVRPNRIYDYTLVNQRPNEEDLWKRFPLSIPYRIIDSRIQDLAIHFWQNPSDKLRTGFCRFEDTVRERCESEEHGKKLFEQAFRSKDSLLQWEELSQKEQAVRASFIIESYSCFRNPRAHREKESTLEELLSEFLILNQLFRFEGSATQRPKPKRPESDADIDATVDKGIN